MPEIPGSMVELLVIKRLDGDSSPFVRIQNGTEEVALTAVEMTALAELWLEMEGEKHA